MRAYKILSDGRSQFTGWRWPLPARGRPGEWVSATGPLSLCNNGIHASTVNQLPQWLGDEIWEIELDREVLRTEPALVAARARLVRRVEEWNEEAQLAFCHDCAGRACGVVGRNLAGRNLAGRNVAGREILTGKIEPFAGRGMAAAVGYWTALLAGQGATGRRAGPDYDAAFAAERAAQAEWLRRALRLGE